MICSEDREEWRPLADLIYGLRYEISNIGRVRRSAPGRHTRPGRMVTADTMSSGHKRVLLWADGASRHFFVHRLVLEAFIGSAPAGTVCCHNNDVPGDNRLGNLRWDTHKANTADSWLLGGQRRRCGTERGRVAKLNDATVRKIRDMVATGLPQMKAAEMFCVSRATISMLVSRKTWGHI